MGRVLVGLWGVFAALAGAYLLIAGLSDRLPQDYCFVAKRFSALPEIDACWRPPEGDFEVYSEVGAAVLDGRLSTDELTALLAALDSEVFDKLDDELRKRFERTLLELAESPDERERRAAALILEGRISDAFALLGNAANDALTAGNDAPDESLRRAARWRLAGDVISEFDQARAVLAYSRAAELDLDCLARATYYEGRGHGLELRRAVAEVVMNRVERPEFPNTICEVVYQGSGRKTGCVFSFTCDGSEEREPSGADWRLARQVAAYMVVGSAEPITAGATHYHSGYVEPYWSKDIAPVAEIEGFLFYKFD